MNSFSSPQGIDVEEVTDTISRHPSMLIGLYFYKYLFQSECCCVWFGLCDWGKKRRKIIVT